MLIKLYITEDDIEKYYNFTTFQHKNKHALHILKQIFTHHQKVSVLIKNFGFSPEYFYALQDDFLKTIVRYHIFKKDNTYTEDQVVNEIQKARLIKEKGAGKGIRPTQEIIDILKLSVAHGWTNIRISDFLTKKYGKQILTPRIRSVINSYTYIFPNRIDITQIEVLSFRGDQPDEQWLVYLNDLFNAEKQHIELDINSRHDVESILNTNKLLDDIENIEKLSIDGLKQYSEKHRQQLVRTKQFEYRVNVLKLWENKCAVTGCDIPELLIAGHIKPFSSYILGRNDANNGVPLIPTLATLFDKYLISFDTNNNLCVASALNNNRQLLGLETNSKLRKPLTSEQHKYMSHHYQRFLNKELYARWLLNDKSLNFFTEIDNLVIAIQPRSKKSKTLTLFKNDVSYNLLLSTPKEFWRSYFKIFEEGEKITRLQKKEFSVLLQSWFHKQYLIYRQPDAEFYLLLIHYLKISMSSTHWDLVKNWVFLNKNSLTNTAIKSLQDFFKINNKENYWPLT